MDNVGIQITGTKYGLHDGHRALVEFGKQFGPVTINLLSDMRGRNFYLKEGIEVTPKLAVNIIDIQKECEKFEIGCREIPSLNKSDISESRRIYFYRQAASFVELYRDKLMADRYIDQAIYSIMYSRLVHVEGDVFVCGPEVPHFFYKHISSLFNWKERIIYPNIVKGPNGIRCGSSWNEAPFDTSRIRKMIDGAHPYYTIGNNVELVKELNAAYSGRLWKIHDILVYEGGFVSGRIEVTSFECTTNKGLEIFEEVDYYA